MLKLPLLVLFGAGLALAQSAGTFVPTGSMAAPRTWGHTATLLRDGRVLVTGGYDGQADLASAELYDPFTGTFTATGSMSAPRNSHTATLLNDGRVLIAGGSYDRGVGAELYDPSTGTFSPTGKMVSPDQYAQSATLLPDGKVLLSEGVYGAPLAGGGGVRVLSAAPELYDPVTGTFSPAGRIKLSILGATATLLPDGKVLQAGGYATGDTCLYDPVSGSYTRLGDLLLSSHTATLLTNGTVLIAGGWDIGDHSSDEILPVAAAQIYLPSLGRFKPAGSMFDARDGHSATLLPGGLVLVAGGEGVSGNLASAELYDPATGVFARTGAMNGPRAGHQATLLRDGRVLITGGLEHQYPPNPGLATAELYVPSLRVISAAGFSGPLAPESLASLLGSSLALVTATADPLPLPAEDEVPPSAPTSLGGVSVSLRDSTGVARLAPLYFVSPSRIDFEVPAGTALGDLTLEVLNSPTQLPPVTGQIRNVVPGLLTSDDGTPDGYGLRLEPNATGTILQLRNTIVLDDRPVYLILYATGIRNHSSLANVQCTIGATTLPVEYAGPSGAVPGLDQVNISLTSALKGTGVANLVLTVDGIFSNIVSVDIR